MKKRIISCLLTLVLTLALCPAARASYEPLDAGEGCEEYIMAHEGFSEHVYSDGTGWYIGYGVACGKDDYPDGISEEEARELLREKLTVFSQSVNAFLQRYDVEVEQWQFDALCCMTYNFGPSWLNVSNRLPAYLAKGIENYSDQQIVSAFAAWCHVGGKVNEGLLKRRIMEANMFLYDDYSCDISNWCWLILDAAGGQVESDVVCYPTGESYGALPAAERAGCVLTSWVWQDGTELLSDDTVLRSGTVRAVWSDEAVDLPGGETDKPSAPETEGLYSDVDEGAWYYSYVSELSARGVISGFEDGSFRPGESVSFGQALKLVLLAAGYKEQSADEDQHWAAGYLEFAEKKGFVEEGVIDDLDAVISRDEIADMAAAALELDDEGVSRDTFADTSRSSVLALYSQGIVEGSIENGERLFKGRDDITRAELSAIIWRIADYVDRTLILFFDYRIPINYDLEFNPYDSESFYTEDGRVYYDDDGYDVRYGIDVSFYQKDIDWQAVAADGIDFAIIRAGYRGCSEGELFTDERFYEYIDGALEAGIDVGLYFFSQAVTPEEAVQEAEYLLSLAEGYDITFPIAFDWEPLNYSYSRTKNYDYSVLTDCAIAFCDTIETAGYQSMIYFNPSFAYLKYDLTKITDRTVWLAHYTENTNYKYNFHMWQYGSSGSVDGIAGRVDMDIAFVDFSRS